MSPHVESLLIVVFWAVFLGGLVRGLLASAQSTLQLLRAIWVYFLRPGRNLKKLGDWAVVTGSTDGIGKAYAEALAKRRELAHEGCGSDMCAPNACDLLHITLPIVRNQPAGS